MIAITYKRSKELKSSSDYRDYRHLKSKTKYKVKGKNMKEITLYGGINLEEAWKMLLEESTKCNDTCFCKFNTKKIYSTETLDEIYLKVLGKTKAEFDKAQKEWHDNYERELAEHKASIPTKAEEYKKRARGLVKEEELEYWDKIVPIRLDDLYRGMELEQTLQVCAIMRDETLTYDKRLHKAYKLFMDSNHSGMSARLTANMFKRFCPDGVDLADAVMNFRFEKKQ